MRFCILLFFCLGVSSLNALDFRGGGWRLSLAADGSWNSLQYQGVELIQPGAGQPALKMQLGSRRWIVPTFLGATFDTASNTVQLKYSEAGFEILEKISLNAHGMPGLLGRRIELVCPTKPTVFYNVGFLTPLPLEGFCYAPVSFLGDRRNIREIEGDPSGNLFRERAERIQGKLLKGNSFLPAAYIMPLQFELPNRHTVTFLHDDREDPARQVFFPADGCIVAQQSVGSEGWAKPGARHAIGNVYLLATPGTAPAALASHAVWKWFDAVGFRVPEKRPDWLSGAVVFEFNPLVFGAEQGFAAAAEAFLPRLQRMGFNTLWCQPVNTGASIYMPIDYLALNPSLGSEEEYRAMVARARAGGMRFLQDIVPHGGRVEEAQMRGNSVFALRYLVRGTPASGYALSGVSAEWRDYLARSARYFLSLGVDGFRIDQCYGSNPDWKSADFPRRDQVPAGISPEWWKRSAPMDRKNPPPLRASLAGRSGGLQWIHAIRSVVKQVSPDDGAVLAETMPAVYGLEGDFLYDFLGRFLLYKFSDMNRGDFVAGLSRRLEEQYLTDPRDLLRLRYIEVHDCPPAISLVGLGAARALTAVLYFSHGIPLAGEARAGFDIGNGPFLQTLNRLRAEFPELGRGTTEYLAVKSSRPEVFTVRRTFRGTSVVGLVNLSGRMVDTRISPLRTPCFDVLTGEAMDPERVMLPPWGYRLLSGQRCPAMAEPRPHSATRGGQPQLFETPERFTVTNNLYTLVIHRRTGLMERFGKSDCRISSSLLLTHRVSQHEAKVTVSPGEKMVIRAEGKHGDDTLVLAYCCDPEGVDVTAELAGHSTGETVALLFSGTGVDRWQADTIEGRLDDFFGSTGYGDRDVDLLSKMFYQPFQFYTHLWPRTILWQSERQMLHPKAGAIRIFGADGRGTAFHFPDLLGEPTAGMAVYSRFAGVPGWHLGVFFRQPSPVMRDVPQRFRFRLNPARLDRISKEKTGNFQLGALAFHHDSNVLQLSGRFGRILLNRRGGGIASWQDAGGRTLLEKMDFRSLDGYAAPVFASGDLDAGCMMMQQGKQWKLRFFSRPRNPGYQGPGPAFSLLTEYTFDQSPSFQLSSAVLRFGNLPARGKRLGWQAKVPAPESVVPDSLALLPSATGGEAFPYLRWKSGTALFSTDGKGAAATEAPPPSPVWPRNPLREDFRSFGYCAQLVNAAGNCRNFSVLTVNPAPWVSTYRTRFAEGRGGAGDLALRFRNYNSARISLSGTVAPGRKELVLHLAGEKLLSGSRLECEVICNDLKSCRIKRFLDLPAGTFDWREFRLPLEFSAQSRSLSVRFKLWDPAGSIRLDDVSIR